MDEHHNPIEFTLPLLDKNGLPTEDATVGVAQKGAKIDMVEGQLAIFLTEPLEVESKDYVVKMTETLHNKNKCVQYYEVRFVSPFVVSLDVVTLRTLIANADAKNLNDYLTIEDADGNAIVDTDDNNNLVLTNTAKSVYGLTVAPRVKYTLAYDKTGNDTEDSFGGNLNIVGENEDNVMWDNDGTDLQNDKIAHYTATVTFEHICKLTEESDVKVLSTANSNGVGVDTEYANPNLAQWTFYVPDYEQTYVLDLGVANGKFNMGGYIGEEFLALGWPAEMIGKMQLQNSYADYEVIPTAKTAGMILVHRPAGEHPMTGQPVEAATLTIYYKNLDTAKKTMEIYSPYENGFGLGDWDGEYIMGEDGYVTDENNNAIIIYTLKNAWTATKADKTIGIIEF